jgi:Transglycosylase SLT domain
MTVQPIQGIVEAAIQRASNASGVDFGFLMRTARRESGLDPSAHAKTSSAAGLFQFLDQTWLSMLKQHGAQHGYASYANMIQRGHDGRYHVAGGAGAKASVMGLRLDPQAAAMMAGAFAADASAYLKGRIGREPTAGELYSAHLLGPAGSARLIEAVNTKPSASAAAMFPAEASANRPIFYHGGKPATVGQVLATLTAMQNGATAPVTRVPQTVPDIEGGGFIEDASARRIEQMQEEQVLVALVLRGPPGGNDLDLGGQTASSLFSTEMLRTLSETAPKV